MKKFLIMAVAAMLFMSCGGRSVKTDAAVESAEVVEAVADSVAVNADSVVVDTVVAE